MKKLILNLRFFLFNLNFVFLGGVRSIIFLFYQILDFEWGICPPWSQAGFSGDCKCCCAEFYFDSQLMILVNVIVFYVCNILCHWCFFCMHEISGTILTKMQMILKQLICLKRSLFPIISYLIQTNGVSMILQVLR